MQHTQKFDTNKGIIAWFVMNPVAANLLMFAVLLLGYLSYGELRREDFPVLPPNTLTIQVNYESGSASIVETGIAIKVEEAIQAVQGIKKVKSISTPTGCTIFVEKVDNYDMDTLLRDVKNKVDSIHNLPESSERPIVETNPEKQLAVYVQVYGDRPTIELQEIAEELRLELLARSEINDAELIGKAEPMFSITFNENSLQKYGFTLQEIAEKINNHSFLAPSATLRNEERSLRIKTGEQDTNIEEFRTIPLLEDKNGIQVVLGDVANIQESFQSTPSVLARFNGVDGVAIAVYMDPKASVVKVVEEAKKVIASWEQNGRIPHDVSLTTWDDASRYITERLTLLQDNILQGVVLVFMVLLLFINVRIAFCVALSLPFIFLGTFIFMNDTFFGLSFNEITTFGFIMALGIIVDDAVVVGESVESLRMKNQSILNQSKNQNKEETNSRYISILGTHLVATPTIFGVLTTVATFLPLAFVSGEIGDLFGQFATVVSVALLLSMVQSKLILPVHLAALPPYSENEKQDFLSGLTKIQAMANAYLEKFAQKIYRPLLRTAFENCYAALIILIAIFVLSTGLLINGKVGFTFFPTVADNLITAKITMSLDSGYGLTKKHALMLEHTALEADKKLRGKNDSIIESIFINSPNDEEVIALVEAKTISEIKNAQYTMQDFMEEWKKRIGMPEGTIFVNVSSTVDIAENFTPELTHTDKEILQEASVHILNELQMLAGVLNVEHNLADTTEQWQIELNNSGYALGLTNKMLYEQIYAMFDGITTQSFTRNQDEVDVKISYKKQNENNISQLRQALIRTPDNKIVPLTAIATITIESSEEKITRIGNKRIAYFSVLLDKSKLSASEVQIHLTEIMENLNLRYPGLSMKYGGETEDMDETMNSLIIIMIISLLIVYTLLAIPLKNYFQPLLIMSVIPFGFVGAITGHWLTSFDFSIMSIMGVIALAGVIINNSLLLITAYNDNIKEGFTVLEATEKACLSRLRPILLTSATTFMGLVPLFLNDSEQAKMLIPAATSLAYGILFGTIITLILIPVLLKIANDVSMFTKDVKQSLIKLKLSH